MAFTTRRQPEALQLTAQAETLPEFINEDALNKYYEHLPIYVQRMSTSDLVARANNIFHDDGVLSTWERGTTDPRTGKDVLGSLEPHAVAYAHQKGYRDDAERDRLINEGFYKRVLPLVDERVQRVIRTSLRDRIVAASSSPDHDDVFAKFIDCLADYNPRDLEHARQLSADVFQHYTSLRPSRLAPFVSERTYAAFAAISRNSQRAECAVPESGAGVRVTVNMAKVGMLQRALYEEVKAAGSYGRTPDAESFKRRYAPLYDQLGYEMPSIQKTVIPTNARIVVGATRDSLSTAIRAGSAAAQVAKSRVDVAPQKMLGVATAGAIGITSLVNAPVAHAAPRIESSISLQVPEIKTVDLANVELVSANSAMPAAFVEAAHTKAESQEDIANQALRAEIHRLAKQSRESKGFWSKWKTVDPDELYDAIIREEKRHPHGVVNRFLVLPQLKAESFLKVNAVSGAGAKGLTQFMPGTWRTWGHGKSPYDPAASVRAQFEYDIALYNLMHKRYPHMNQTQLTRLMLAGYNAGPNNSYVKNGNVPPRSFAHGQTYNYVHIITKGVASMRDRLPAVHGSTTVHKSAAPKHAAPKVVTPAFAPSATFMDMLNGTVSEGDFSPIRLTSPAETSESELNPTMLNSMLGRLSVDTTVEQPSAAAEANSTVTVNGDTAELHSTAASAIPAALPPASLIAKFNSNPVLVDETPPTVHELAAASVDPATSALPKIETPQIAAPDNPIKPENRDPANTPLPETAQPFPNTTVTTPAPVETPTVQIPEAPAASSTPQPSTADLMQAFAAVDRQADTPQAAPISIDLRTTTETKPQAIEIPLATTTPAPAPVTPVTPAVAPILTPDSTTGQEGTVQDMLPASITAPAPVEVPKNAEKKVEAPQPKAAPKHEAGVQEHRQAEIEKLKKSGDFKKSQALDDAQRSPLEKKLAAQGEKNGRLHDVERLGSHWGNASLYAPAAEQFRKMDAAFYKEFGYHLKVNDSYRSYARQVTTKQEAINNGRSQFAATPGHSKHGWGLAVDLGGGLQSFNSKEYKWMLKHALDFGFNHPDFADDSSSPEPWHWEYVLSE